MPKLNIVESEPLNIESIRKAVGEVSIETINEAIEAMNNNYD